MKGKNSGFFSNLLEGLKESMNEALEEIAENTEEKSVTDAVNSADKTGKSDEANSDNKTEKSEKTIDAISVFLNGVSKAFEKSGVSFNVVTEKAEEAVNGAVKAASSGWNETHEGNLVMRGTTLLRCEGDDEFVIVPEGVTKIDHAAFENHVHLKRVQLPDSLHIISGGAFRGCVSLSTVKLPPALDFLGESAFENCASLNGETIQQASDLPDEMDKTEIEFEPGQKWLVVPESVIHLGKSVFKGCTSLENVYVSSRLKRISSEAFWGCDKLSCVYWKCPDPNAINVIGRGAFKIAEDYLSLDYFDWSGNHIKRVSPTQEDYEERYPYLVCIDSPAVQCVLRSIMREICERTMDATWRDRYLRILNQLLKLTYVISNGDAYAFTDAATHMKAFILALPQNSTYNENLVMQVVYMHTMLAIGGNGVTYRENDALWRIRMKTDYEGVLCDIVKRCLIEQNPPDEDTLSEEETEDFLRELEELSQDEKDDVVSSDDAGTDVDEADDEAVEVSREDVIQAFQNEMGLTEKTGSSDKTSASERISIDGQVFEIDDMLLWIGLINLLGGVVNTNRYNPRIWHHTGWVDKGETYWDFVDVIEGLLRGAGYEKTRYTPENVYEEDGVTRWCAAWSRSMHDAELDLGIVQIRYARTGDDEKYRDVFMLLDRHRASIFRSLFDEYGFGDNICAWFNGVDVFMFRTV